MKKKFIIPVLSIILAISLTACGGSSDSSSSTTAAAVADTANSETEATTEETEAEETAAANEIVFDGMTVVDNDECSIEITGTTSSPIWGDQLTVLLENKSEDKSYMFSVQDISIDGLEISDTFASTVAPGKKSNETLEISDSDSRAAGITEPTDIEITFKVYDSDDWMADPVALVTTHVYLYGEDKATTYVREPQSTDTVIVDDDNITVIVTDYDPESIWGYAVDFYLVNKTDTDLMFATSDESINGFMVDPFYAKSVPAGKSAFSSMSWFSNNLEENGIEDVEEIEFTLRVHDNDNYSAPDLFNEVITLNP